MHLKSTHTMNQRCVALPLGVKLLLNHYFIPATRPRTVCTFFVQLLRDLLSKMKKLGGLREGKDLLIYTQILSGGLQELNPNRLEFKVFDKKGRTLCGKNVPLHCKLVETF